MNQPESDDSLDNWLRQSEQYIEDRGFTARVVASLPRRRRIWWRPALLLGSLAISSGLAVLWLPWGNLQVPDLAALLALDISVLMPWVLITSVVAAMVWATISALECKE